MKRLVIGAVFGLLGISTVPARGDVKLPAIFGDHMVLQAGKGLPFWGTADAGEKVTVKAAGQERSATADENGKWRITLEPIASAQPIEVTVMGKNTITIKDVLVGEVWLCSGQSNMGFQLKRASNAEEAIKAADRPDVRLFTVTRSPKDQPQADLQGKWERCSPSNAGEFSAVAYFFGLDVQQATKKPVGLIHSSWGGTRAEAWMTKPAFDALKLPYEPEWTDSLLNPKPAKNAKKPPAPKRQQAPAALYNGMIAPLAGYAMRGAIWYQGEANTGRSAEYERVLSAVITSWRDAWANAGGADASSERSLDRDFPFLVVQLANFTAAGRDWPTLRAGQAAVAKKLPNVGLAVAIDVGMANDIHPTDKQTVGSRLALAARKIAYGENVVASGPSFKTMTVSGNSIEIAFDHADGGLVSSMDELKGFEVAGPDGNFVPADAKIQGDKVVVSAPGVANPIKVRYGWANNPTCTLYNQSKLPAVPFEATQP